MIYSNCLLEALKAKLKDWEGVTLHKIPARFTGAVFPGAAAYWKSAYESLRWNDLESEQPEKDSCISIAYRNKNGMPVIQCINSMEIGKYPETQYWRYEEILKENMQIDFEKLQERSSAY